MENYCLDLEHGQCSGRVTVVVVSYKSFVYCVYLKDQPEVPVYNSFKGL